MFYMVLYLHPIWKSGQIIGNILTKTLYIPFLMADISFNIACKELKIAQVAHLNQLFQLLHLVHLYGHSFYDLRIFKTKLVSSTL